MRKSVKQEHNQKDKTEKMTRLKYKHPEYNVLKR